MLIGNKLESLRNQIKYTQKDVAEKIGMTANGYQLAIYKNDFKYSTLLILAKLYNITISQLVSDEEVILQSNENSDCVLCQQKDELITALKQTIDAKEELIQSLKARLEIQQNIIEKKAAG